MALDPLRLAAGVAAGVGPALAQASREPQQYEGHQTSGGEMFFDPRAPRGDENPDDFSDHPDYPKERAAMHTPHVPEALRMYDDLPTDLAVVAAWTNAGPYPEWHEKCRRQVHALMPVLAHNLDRMEADYRAQNPTT